MKVGTLTTHSAHNYGAVLQAYALESYINSLGVSCQILNYRPRYAYNAYRVLKAPSSLKGALEFATRAANYPSLKRRHERFVRFQNDCLPLTKPVYGQEDLCDLAREYDCVFCGSDQIWNPNLHGFDIAYFLPGVEDSTTKYSYAASFGSDSIPATVEPEMAKRIEGFSKFACRERNALDLVEKLTGKQPAFVLDPVFLLGEDHWRGLASHAGDFGDYALIYFLSNQANSGVVTKEKAKMLGLSTVSIGFSPRDVGKGYTKAYDLGPKEFISAIADADVVVTNSFHGTCFSIILGKPFYTRIQTSGETRNQRLISLLEALGLEDRLFTNETAATLELDKPIDYANVKDRLNSLVESSKSYIHECLLEAKLDR